MYKAGPLRDNDQVVAVNDGSVYSHAPGRATRSTLVMVESHGPLLATVAPRLL